jgi:hypothetical protein
VKLSLDQSLQNVSVFHSVSQTKQNVLSFQSVSSTSFFGETTCRVEPEIQDLSRRVLL